MSTETVGLTSFDLEQVRHTTPSLMTRLTVVSLVMATAGTASPSTVGRGQEWAGGTSAGSPAVRVKEVVVSHRVVQDDVPPATPAERLARLKADTDLTWDQIARLFGVSRRAVHQWAVGGRMNSHNIELLALLERLLVTEVSAVDSAARRAALFAPDQTGETPFERALGIRATADVNVSGNALTALEQVRSAR